MRRSWWFGIAFVATVLGVVIAWAVHTTPEVQVATAQVTAGPITRLIVATGTVQAVTTVEVGSQVSGSVQSLAVDYNSPVHAGQILARLDPSSYDAELQQARAALLQAQADVLGFQTAVDDARVKLTRAQALADGQITPQSDLDAARIALNQAEADLRGGNATVTLARAAVDQAAVNLEHTIIRSPIEGIVIDREVDVGQTLAASIQSPVLFRIADDLKHVQLQAEIDESDVGGLIKAEPATFTVDSYPDQTFHGTVSQVRLQPEVQETAPATAVATSTAPPAAGVAATVVSYTAIIDVANPDERLRPGMTAVVTLDGSRRDSAVRIPNSVLSFRPPADVLQALGERDVSPSDAATVADVSNPSARGTGEYRDVWEYDGKSFTPIAIHVGLANDQWTELLSGPVHPDDALVTSAVVRQRARISAR